MNPVVTALLLTLLAGAATGIGVILKLRQQFPRQQEAVKERYSSCWLSSSGWGLSLSSIF